MAYDYESMRRIRMDPKMVEEIQRSPQMRAEQGPDFMQGWGGPSGYRQLAELPTFERLTYAAILEGHTDPSQIEVVTGLSSTEVSSGLAGLEKLKLVTLEEPELK